MTTPKIKFLAISVGNTRTSFACIDSDNPHELTPPRSEANSDMDLLASEIKSLFDAAVSADADVRLAIALASVNDAVAGPLSELLAAKCGQEVFRIGEDLPLPIETDLDPETIVGVDRLLGALAAYTVVGKACVVVDAGTAVTVDFIDDGGVFHGGAIMPGVQMQLSAMHEHTALLPELQYEHPADEPWGRNTSQAMLQGVHFGIRGAVRMLAERYAEEVGAYPQILATGGDADALFNEDEFIERIVPNLTLIGIALTCTQALEAGEEDE
ncbi:MAG: type III pantothenate kinase [Phycisphaerales bacterium JB038]